MSKRASGGTLAAFLILAAIVGFAVGAYLGTQSDDAEPSAASTDPADTETPDGTDDGDDGDAPGDDEPDEQDEEGDEPPADGELTFTLDRSSAASNEEINYEGRLESGEEGVELQVQRSIDGGDWEDFPVTTTTGSDGGFSGNVQTQRSGENRFRVVRIDDDSVVSEPVAVDIA